jgi:hypothetical protein
MSFLHPWMFALGAVTLGLPVLIHYLTRPRPVRLPLSTMRFVREVIQQRRTFHRLRNFLILLLRTAAVCLLVWAFARPLIGDKPLIATDDSASAVRIVVLDVSQSMGASSRGISTFERARSVAAEFLAHRSGLRANLILAGAKARPVFEQCSTNVAALRDELSRAKTLPERLNVQAAIASAAEMLGNTSGNSETRRELVVVSDFQRTNWGAADFSPLPADTVIELEAAGPAEAPPNLAVLRVGVQGRPERDREIRVDVEVGNYSINWKAFARRASRRRCRPRSSCAGQGGRSGGRLCKASTMPCRRTIVDRWYWMSARGRRTRSSRESVRRTALRQAITLSGGWCRRSLGQVRQWRPSFASRPTN